jgi:hypothetical protein
MSEMFTDLQDTVWKQYNNSHFTVARHFRYRDETRFRTVPMQSKQTFQVCSYPYVTRLRLIIRCLKYLTQVSYLKLRGTHGNVDSKLE